MKRRLVDTGPLVAFLNRGDKYHHWAVERWEESEPPLLTCETVLSEACFLLRKVPGGAAAVLDLLIRGVLAIPLRLEEEAEPIAKMMARYAGVPMSLADACLVRLVEKVAGSEILTLNARLRVYRKNGRQLIPAILPGAERQRRTRRRRAAVSLRDAPALRNPGAAPAPPPGGEDRR